jgi:hypothetical protein
VLHPSADLEVNCAMLLLNVEACGDVDRNSYSSLARAEVATRHLPSLLGLSVGAGAAAAKEARLARAPKRANFIAVV